MCHNVLFKYYYHFIADGHEFWKTRILFLGWQESAERLIESNEYQKKYGTSLVPGKGNCNC